MNTHADPGGSKAEASGGGEKAGRNETDIAFEVTWVTQGWGEERRRSQDEKKFGWTTGTL
jgi:hypothetical protein